MADTRYELVRLDGTAKFCPKVGDRYGFATATDAMLHLFEMLPGEALLWRWAPVWEDHSSQGDGSHARNA